MDKKKKIVVKKYSDEVSVEKFIEMKEVKSSEGRVKLVDYEKLVEEMNGKVLSVRGIGKLMMECSDGMKKKVYYSEVLGMLKRLENREGIVVERKRDSGSGIIYYKLSINK